MRLGGEIASFSAQALPTRKEPGNEAREKLLHISVEAQGGMVFCVPVESSAVAFLH